VCRTCVEAEKRAGEELWCPKCERWLMPEDFIWRKNGSRYGYCRGCTGRAKAEWNEANPDRIRIYNKARRFSMTPDEYLEFAATLPTLCEGCGAKEGDSTGRALATDHNHETDDFRGILCKDCNQAIGLLHDNPALLRRLADYLEQPLRWPGVKIKRDVPVAKLKAAAA